jgi:hypothetical protein
MEAFCRGGVSSRGELLADAGQLVVVQLDDPGIVVRHELVGDRFGDSGARSALPRYANDDIFYVLEGVMT